MQAGANAIGKGRGQVEVLHIRVPAVERDGNGADGAAEMRLLQVAAGGPDGRGGGAQQAGAQGTMEGAGKAEAISAWGENEVEVFLAAEGGEGREGRAVECDVAAVFQASGLSEKGPRIVTRGRCLGGVGHGEAGIEHIGELGHGAKGAETGVREVGGEEEVEFRHASPFVGDLHSVCGCLARVSRYRSALSG